MSLIHYAHQENSLSELTNTQYDMNLEANQIPDLINFDPDSQLVQSTFDAVGALNALHDNSSFANIKAEHIAKLCMAAFLASLRQDEGRAVRGTITLLSPDQFHSPIVLARPLQVDGDELVSLLHVSASGTVGVRINTSGELELWGTAEHSKRPCLRIQILGPGTMTVNIVHVEKDLSHTPVVIKNGRPYTPPAVSEETLRDLLDDIFSSTEDSIDSVLEQAQRVPQIISVIKSMRAQHHGGTIIVVPNSAAQENITIKHALHENGRNFLKDCLTKNYQKREVWEQHIDDYIKWSEFEGASDIAAVALHQLGALTALDGAVVIGTDFSVYGYSGKLPMPNTEQVYQIQKMDLLLGFENQTTLCNLKDFHGTRHQSAAFYVHENRSAIAIVASQDDRLTILAWDKNKHMVLALEQLEFFFAIDNVGVAL